MCLSGLRPAPFYPLPPHFSIMDTLKSFISLLSIMSFKLFPFFLFLTFHLLLCPPPSPAPRPPVVPHSLLCPSYHQQLVAGNQSLCLTSLHDLLHLLLSSPSSPTPPWSPLTLLSSFMCQWLIPSKIFSLPIPLF